MPDRKSKLWEAFDYMQELPDNWDSYGAKKIPQDCIDLAEHICNSFPLNIDIETDASPTGAVNLYINGMKISVEKEED